MMANTGEVTIQGTGGNELVIRYHDKAPYLSVTAVPVTFRHVDPKEGTKVQLDRAGSFRLLEELAAAIEVAWPD